MNEINENHLSALYRLLGHDGHYSRMGSLDYSNGKYENKIVKGLGEVLAYARQWNGKRNIFIGRGLRDKDGGVIASRVITFDVDPIRPKGVAANDEQHALAISAGKTILADYPGGYLASSGNGVLLVYATGSFTTDTPNYAQIEPVFTRELQQKVEKFNVKIDATHYSEAVIKAIGTMSTKGDINLRRQARWINYPVQPFQRCPKLLERLSSISPVQQSIVQGIDIKDVMSKFNGDRSVADFHLVTYLKKAGVGPEDALKSLQANPLGRKEERPDDWQRLIGKIYGKSIRDNESVTVSYFDQLFQKNSEIGNSIKTGFKSFDEAIRQLPSGEISTFAARSGFGKSTFACTISEFLRNQGKKVLYFSTEMQETYIMHKLVAISTGVSPKQLIEKTFTDRQCSSIKEYQQKFSTTPVRICDDFQPTLDKVRNEVLAYKPDVVIFDHINQADTHWEKIAQFMRGLKEIANTEQIPVINMSQLNEPPRNSKGEVMQSVRGDVRGTQEILYLSANFVFMTNPYEVKTQYQPVEFHIAKCRYGISGQVVTLYCDKESSKYVEREEENADLPKM